MDNNSRSTHMLRPPAPRGRSSSPASRLGELDRRDRSKDAPRTGVLRQVSPDRPTTWEDPVQTICRELRSKASRTSLAGHDAISEIINSDYRYVSEETVSSIFKDSRSVKSDTRPTSSGPCPTTSDGSLGSTFLSPLSVYDGNVPHTHTNDQLVDSPVEAPNIYAQSSVNYHWGSSQPEDDLGDADHESSPSGFSFSTDNGPNSPIQTLSHSVSSPREAFNGFLLGRNFQDMTKPTDQVSSCSVTIINVDILDDNSLYSSTESGHTLQNPIPSRFRDTVAALFGGANLASAYAGVKPSLWEPYREHSPLIPGVYQLVNIESGLTMDLSGVDKAPIVGKPGFGGQHQRWEITKQEGGYSIQSIVTGRFITVHGKAKHGVNLGTSNARTVWKIEQTSTPDVYRISWIKDNSPELCMAIKRTNWLRDHLRDTFADWAHEEYVQLLSDSRHPRQNWRLIPCSSVNPLLDHF